MAISEPVSFTISVDGDVTGEKFKGEFRAKVRLSHRDQLRRDQVRRDLLGNNPAACSARAIDQAEIFSQLAVRIVKSPSWWTESSGGLDLEDDSVVAEVYKAALKIETDALAALHKEADAAKAELEKVKSEQ